MRPIHRRALVLAVAGITWAGFWGCATPAVVFVSPDYSTHKITSVTVLGFADFPGKAGSGPMVADIFEKYLFNLHYQIVDSNQPHDAEITGSISDLTETSEQTVMVDIPQESEEPIYQDVTIQGRRGIRTVTEQVGTQTVYNDQMVPQTETLPARVGISARMVAVKNGELLWSGSASEDGSNISSAAEAASAKMINALQKNLSVHQ